MSILQLEAIIGKLQTALTPDELAYLVRHLGEPYYSDGAVQLGHRQTANAQSEVDGDLVTKASRTTPRCQTCGYIGCREHRQAAA